MRRYTPNMGHRCLCVMPCGSLPAVGYVGMLLRPARRGQAGVLRATSCSARRPVHSPGHPDIVRGGHHNYKLCTLAAAFRRPAWLELLGTDVAVSPSVR